jgi:ribosomal protein L11 methyltransferase
VAAPWINLRIDLPGQHADAFADALLAGGALSVEVGDAAAGTPEERAWFDEPGSAAAPGWHSARLEVLCPAGIDVATLLRGAAAQVDLPAPAYHLSEVADLDWVRSSQAQFDPIRVSRRIWVVPSWHAPVDASAINLVIDPGLAFGSGSHPSTKLCLRWLDENLAGGEHVVDYGCGSGILAIAAAKLGAAEVVAIDIDLQAVVATRQNASRNRVSIDARDTEAAAPIGAGVVVANILANPLVQLAPLLIRILRPGGRIALAGILAAQADAVIAAYKPAVALAVAGEEDGWVCLAGERR